MERGNLSRRGFLRRSLAAMAAAGLPAWYARETFAAEQRETAARARKADANSRIVLGAIGCGGQGTHIMDRAREDKNVQVVAVCDVDANRRKATAKKVGNDCKDFEDFRELLDNGDVNAVTVGTPDHWHTLIAIAALK